MLLPTCLHAFLESLAAHPEAPAIRIVGRADADVELSYVGLHHLAACAVAAYRHARIEPGDRVILALPTCREFIALYLGALFHGVIPLVEPVPHPAQETSSAVSRLRRKADLIGARCILVQKSALAAVAADALPLVISAEDMLFGHEPVAIAPPGDGDTIAHLQSTSGTTGEQRVLPVRHRNIVANVAGIGSKIQVRPPDSLCFWLPLFHDMGLIAVLCSFYWRRPMIITDSANFVRSPIRFWLQMMSKYRATITAAPNSAYEACARIARLRRYEQLDLSSVRVAFWGSESIYPHTIQAFEKAFAPYGYRKEMTFPVYGLAEATLAATLPQVEMCPVVSEFADPSGGRIRQTVCVGRPLPDHELRILDINRHPVGDGVVGEIELLGPSVIQPTTEDGFLRTGDLGFLRNGDLYVIGRKKELIIANGRNFVPADIETFVDEIVQTGIQKGVAAIGVVRPELGTERLHLAIESRVLPVPNQTALEDRVRLALAESFGITGVVIQWVAKGTIPKTTSGKIQRFRCRDLFLEPAASTASARGMLTCS